MAEGGAARIYDLRIEVPAGWTQTGLSAPRSDGVNLYRTPAAQTELNFKAPAGDFVQYGYQLYSPAQAVTGKVSLNGQQIDSFTFPPSQFQTHDVSSFTRAGQNSLKVDLGCAPAPCDLTALHQYWTRVALVPARSPRTAVGLGVERWWLDAPGSLLSVTGTGPLLYDNVNFLRYLTGAQVQLSWPAGSRIIDASLQVAADQPFLASFRLDGVLLEQARGDARKTVAPTLNLVAFPQAKQLTVRVDCLKTPATPCARIYFTRVSAVPPTVAAPPDTMTFLTGVMAVLLALWLLGKLLRLLPQTRRAA
ncbi:hypothetical protein Q0M94_08115 [Deinococcus radiomollis]|uniref:hypothetical protein n=1 Tax=Deinococcus radiomollis TaxID=468916 RepID=UPI0038925470